MNEKWDACGHSYYGHELVKCPTYLAAQKNNTKSTCLLKQEKVKVAPICYMCHAQKEFWNEWGYSQKRGYSEKECEKRAKKVREALIRKGNREEAQEIDRREKEAAMKKLEGNGEGSSKSKWDVVKPKTDEGKDASKGDKHVRFSS